eukprot:gene7469-1335_t
MGGPHLVSLVLIVAVAAVLVLVPADFRPSGAPRTLPPGAHRAGIILPSVGAPAPISPITLPKSVNIPLALPFQLPLSPQAPAADAPQSSQFEGAWHPPLAPTCPQHPLPAPIATSSTHL